MGILQIEPVSRSGMRFLFSFYGLSETGKTLSALLVAAGLEPDPSKRMLLDTEGGQRGRAYEHEIPGGYLYASLSPPYTPERYIQALAEIEKAGVTVLVTDSASHAWFAEGGVLEMVEESTNRNDMAKWKEPKRRLGKMMQRYRSSDMHHILCSRAKQPLIEEVGANGRKTYVPGPVTPIQEKMMRYDMTVVAQMTGRGKFTMESPQGKCPGNLMSIFQASELMNEDTGRRLAEWVNVRNSLSPEARALKAQASEIAEGGTDPFREFWRTLSRDERDVLQPSLDNYQSIAKAADDERTRRAAESDEQDRADRERNAPNLDDPFGGKPIEHVGNQQQHLPDDRADREVGGTDLADRAAGPPASAEEATRMGPGIASAAAAQQIIGQQAGPAETDLLGAPLAPASLEIPMATDRAGKPDPRRWFEALFLPKLAQQTGETLPWFTGDNAESIKAAERVLGTMTVQAPIKDAWLGEGLMRTETITRPAAEAAAYEAQGWTAVEWVTVQRDRARGRRAEPAVILRRAAVWCDDPAEPR